jgi:4-oxalocrotonate tautomerase
MPLVRIHLSRDATPPVLRAVSETVYQAMVEIASVPRNEKFQIATRHGDDELIDPAEGYLGVTYSASIIFMHMTRNAGRATEVKKAFYKETADGIHAKTGERKEEILINLVEVAREDRSFGNGEMQYAPKL